MTRPHAVPRIVLVACLALAASLALGAGAGVAEANDPAERAAKRFYERGQKLFNLQKFDEALEQYQKAYDAKPIPAFLFNIGQCHRNLENFDAAIFSFKKYLKLEPDADNREQVEGLIEELEEKRAEAKARALRLRDPEPARPDTPPPKPRKPAERAFYTKWWFWTGVAVAGAAAGGGIYAATRPDGPPATTWGAFDFGR